MLHEHHGWGTAENGKLHRLGPATSFCLDCTHDENQRHYDIRPVVYLQENPGSASGGQPCPEPVERHSLDLRHPRLLQP
jgi:hypothetical protein